MFSKIYKISPVFLQNSFITFYGYYWKNRRFGGVFKRNVEEFKKNENFTKEQWHQYQTKELRKLLKHAYCNVPFYNKLYSRKGFTLQDFNDFEISDLKKLPYLEKEDVRKFGTSTLLAKNKSNGKFYKSSGSTGTPIQIYFSKEVHQKWNALYEVRVRNWAGLNYKESRAMIGGRRVLPTAKAIPPYYRYNYAESQAYFSAYHISEETTKEYVDGLIKSKCSYLVGYAKSIFLLSKIIQKQQLNAPKLKAVLTSSEKLTIEMRAVIEAVFQCKVFDAYSGMEACGLISENKYNELLFSPDSGIMEIVDELGNEVEPGEIGEVIATGFLNDDQPLIRYRIGDKVKVALDQQTKSGLNMLKIEEIEGRTEDVIVGKNGQIMVRFHSVFIGIPSIMMAQVIQETYNKIKIKLVVDSNYNNKNEELIKARITSQLGNIMIEFEYVNSIERTSNGKFKAVISKLKDV